MKKKIIIFLALGLVGYLLFHDNCGILPEDTSCKVVLYSSLYELTPEGIIKQGNIDDEESWGLSEVGDFKFDDAKKIMYFWGRIDIDSIKDITKFGYYKLDLNKKGLKPVLMPGDHRWYKLLAVSPDGNSILFRCINKNLNYEILLLNQVTGHEKKLTDDFYQNRNKKVNPLAIWINNHQFIYSSTKVNEKTGKRILYLFDIDTMTQKDLHMDGYYPGAVTPNGKEILLTGGEGKYFYNLLSRRNTVLYNLSDGSTKVIAKRMMDIVNMIWLSDGKGFLYSDNTLVDTWDALENRGGLYYYSLEKRKSVRLKKLFRLDDYGGFLVTKDVNVPLPNTRANTVRRELKAKGDRGYDVVKICNKLKK